MQQFFKACLASFNTGKRITTILILFWSINEFKAQHPSQGFSRIILSPQEYSLNQRIVPEHQGLQPAAWGLESLFHDLLDSSSITKRYASKIHVKPSFSLNTGLNYGDKLDFAAGHHAGISAWWNKEDTWSASLGYSLVGGLPVPYLADLADSLKIIPGAGYATNDGDGIYHAHYTHGHISYKAGKYFHFETGKGKHFWGDGYRSLILSDNSNSYPYFRLTTKIWHIKYTNLWAQLRDISSGQQIQNARKKYVALHALSWNVSKTVNLTVFEMVVWQDRDSLSTRTLDMNYLNPIIFFRPVEYAQGSADNEILGLSFRVKASSDIQMYGQMVLDEFLLYEIRRGLGWWANKIGGQVGIKSFNTFTPGLGFQTEFNVVRPFTYTHGSQVQAWGHLNQPLAHPWGANFYEWVNFFRYKWKDWTFVEQFTWGAFGRDRDTNPERPGLENYGGNVFHSYSNPELQYGNKILQGTKSTFNFHQLEVSRNILPEWNLELFFSHTFRFEKNEFARSSEHFLMIGIRTNGSLRNVADF
ncbi:MAG: hypothetical protein SH856_03530 [Flavobacteriales bacterium]|nr:hypothetical protein [Flavobacteriales bacterium]